MSEVALRLGFLALKAEQYAQFPSIRKMSEDWEAIAEVAAASYNQVAALQRQLREAQEENKAQEDTVAAAIREMDRYKAERDAAIERGVLVWSYVDFHLLPRYKGIRERAEAAERDAAAQRALAERLKARLSSLETRLDAHTMLND